MNDKDKIKSLERQLHYSNRQINKLKHKNDKPYYYTIGAMYQTHNTLFMIISYLHLIHRDNIGSLLINLIMFANKVNVVCVPQTELANDVGVSRRTIVRGMKYLIKHHYIKVLGSRKVQSYLINPYLYCQCSNRERAKLQRLSGMPNGTYLIKNKLPMVYNHYSKFIGEYGYQHTNMKLLTSHHIESSDQSPIRNNININHLSNKNHLGSDHE